MPLLVVSGGTTYILICRYVCTVHMCVCMYIHTACTYVTHDLVQAHCCVQLMREKLLSNNAATGVHKQSRVFQSVHLSQFYSS